MSYSQTLKSTEFNKMIDENFFYPALFVKDDKGFRDCIRETMENDTISLKNLVIFLRKNQNELEKNYYVLPIELLNEEEFPDSEIEKLEKEYSRKKMVGGYIRFLLEEIYDTKFKEKLNEKHLNYFQMDREYCNSFDYDFVGDYLHKLEEANFNYSQFTDKKELRSRKYKNKPEPINNLYNLFKCFAQGEYSKIHIALKNNNVSSNDNPDKLRWEGFDIILNDNAIKEFIPKVRYLPEEEKCKLYDYYQVLIFERQEKLIYWQLQRWFDDFVPSDLDRKYEKFYGKLEQNEKSLKPKKDGATLRQLLETGCKRIADETKRIPSNQIKKVYEEGNIFSDTQISQINKLYEKYYGKKTEYKTVREKIELLIHAIEESEKKKKSWQEIIERYESTYPLSLDRSMYNEDGDEVSLHDFISSDETEHERLEDEINRIVYSYHFEGYADKVFDLFLDEFGSNPCFMNAVAKEIQNHEKLESISLSEIPLPVIYNSIQCITKMITKKDIRHASDEAELFNFESLRNKPFCFIESQIAKFRMIFLIEEWRYDHNYHPWRRFWEKYKKHLPKKILDFDQFTKKMERIYSEVKSWK